MLHSAAVTTPPPLPHTPKMCSLRHLTSSCFICSTKSEEAREEVMLCHGLSSDKQSRKSRQAPESYTQRLEAKAGTKPHLHAYIWKCSCLKW